MHRAGDSGAPVICNSRHLFVTPGIYSQHPLSLINPDEPFAQGDVLVHLIETADEELSKPTREISTTRLQVWKECGQSVDYVWNADACAYLRRGRGLSTPEGPALTNSPPPPSSLYLPCLSSSK